MADYSTTVNFAIKDGLASGNPAKVVKGSDFQLEFDNISTAVATKANLLSPSFSGTVSAPSISTNTFSLNGIPVTVTAAEINALAGLTASTAELNVLDGITPTTAELNVLAGALVTTSNLQKLNAISASAAEINVLDGSLATTGNLNKLNAITATAAELNYVDGVTSSIQTQLDSKLSSVGDFNSTGDISILDNKKIYVGTGQDLAIYHDGSDSYIEDQGVGSFWIRSNGNGFGVQNSSGVVFAQFTESSGVCSLFKIEAGVADKRIETTTDGVEVFGSVKIGSWFVKEDSSGNLMFSLAGGDKMKLDQSGNLTVLGDITAFGTL
jgi:hypothetical protein